ncbi:Rho guanine nucleotide exchange factor 6 [Homalodisca vitripennis]|nr:Rho guanine nucleotide exchange factor 6 [Homalodisca vitripennis]
MEEGGWWEGTFGEKTGWFPSNYVKEYRTQNSLSPVAPTPLDLVAQQKVYRSVVLKDLIDSERAHVTELQGLMKNFLRPLENAEIMKTSEYQQLIGNLPEVVEVHETLLASLEEIANKAAAEQRVGNLFLTTAPRLKQVHMTYCSSHPRAVCILDRYK